MKKHFIMFLLYTLIMTFLYQNATEFSLNILHTFYNLTLIYTYITYLLNILLMLSL